MIAGTVYWFTGLSGAGKSTLAAVFCDRLRASGRTVVCLDGDRLREVFGADLGHSLDDRRASAMRNSRLCQLLAEQGVDVVCATISMFHACQEWNRANLPYYREIYVRAARTTLENRDHKGIYAGVRRGELTNVMGIDLPVEEPQQPDVVVDNDGQRSPAEVVSSLWRDLFGTDSGSPQSTV